jgi:hypothetical protein
MLVVYCPTKYVFWILCFHYFRAITHALFIITYIMPHMPYVPVLLIRQQVIAQWTETINKSVAPIKQWAATAMDITLNVILLNLTNTLFSTLISTSYRRSSTKHRIQPGRQQISTMSLSKQGCRHIQPLISTTDRSTNKTLVFAILSP